MLIKHPSDDDNTAIPVGETGRNPSAEYPMTLSYTARRSARHCQ